MPFSLPSAVSLVQELPESPLRYNSPRTESAKITCPVAPTHSICAMSLSRSNCTHQQSNPLSRRQELVGQRHKNVFPQSVGGTRYTTDACNRVPERSCRLGFYGKTCAGFNDACTTLRWYDPVLEGIPHELDCF